MLPLGLSVEISAADATIQKKIYPSGSTALINSNKEMEKSGLLIEGISETIKNETKEKKKKEQVWSWIWKYI